MEKTEKTPKIYELGYLIVPTVAEENVGREVEAIKAVLAEASTEIITEDAPKLRPLSYTMLKVIGSNRSKFDKAYFGWIKFQASPSVLPATKAKLEKIETFLRMMIVETVRENTMVVQKPLVRAGDAPETEAPQIPDAKAKISEAELDKTIDSLVASS